LKDYIVKCVVPNSPRWWYTYILGALLEVNGVLTMSCASCCWS